MEDRGGDMEVVKSRAKCSRRWLAGANDTTCNGTARAAHADINQTGAAAPFVTRTSLLFIMTPAAHLLYIFIFIYMYIYTNVFVCLCFMQYDFYLLM